MPHKVDGFGLQYTARKSWKAWWFQAGKQKDKVPVTWTKDFHPARGSEKARLDVRYRKIAEAEAQRVDNTPFVVALARPKNDKITLCNHSSVAARTTADEKIVDNKRT